MAPDQRTDVELLRASRTDADAFAAYYRRWERPVLAWMRKRCREPELAADLTAETFATVLAAARRGRAGSDPGWLWSVARSRLIDAHRRGQVADRARRRLGMQRIAVDDHAAEVIDGLDLVAELEAAMSRLEPDQREAIRARVVEDRTYAQIADELSLSPQVVRKRVSRGLATLRQNMEDRP